MSQKTVQQHTVVGFVGELHVPSRGTSRFRDRLVAATGALQLQRNRFRTDLVDHTVHSFELRPVAALSSFTYGDQFGACRRHVQYPT